MTGVDLQGFQRAAIQLDDRSLSANDLLRIPAVIGMATIQRRLRGPKTAVLAFSFNALEDEYREPSSPHLLRDFIALAEADDEGIWRFAKKWGYLGLCAEHGLPERHFNENRRLGPCREWRSVAPSGKKVFLEPIPAWRDMARRARAILRIAANLHRGKVGDADDWKVLQPADFLADRDVVADPDARWDRLLLEGVLNNWLGLGDIRLRFSWFNDVTPSFSWSHDGLFGALALELSVAIQRVDRMATCSACGSLYLPKRRPQAGRRSYCERKECGKRAAWRAASARRREKKSRDNGERQAPTKSSRRPAASRNSSRPGRR